MEFRKDIHGLRAVALLAVLLYHFKVPGFNGGFAGVDIFFVISGFFMTGIIMRGLAAGDFSLAGFYWSRTRRIAPALLVVCAAVLVAGWFCAPPADYTQLGLHAASAVTYVSNFVFKGEDGYFDILSQDKWLLHTWSLSLEWQFYLLYPLMLAWVARWSRRQGAPFAKAVAVALGVMTVLSLALSIFMTPSHPSFSFYLLPARAWEFAAGGLACIYALRRETSQAWLVALRTVSAALVALAIFTTSENVPWPGVAAILPVLGTVLLLMLPITDDALLSNRAMQRLGDWSYGIYLWHWPLLVGLRYAEKSDDPVYLAIGIAGSIILGAVTFAYVETPLRRAAMPRAFKGWALSSLGASLLIAAAGMVVFVMQGVPVRVDAAVLAADRAGGDRYTVATSSVDRPAFALWGDSHAGAVYSALRSAAHEQDGNAYIKSCPVILGADLASKKNSSCSAFTAATLQNISSLAADVPLVIASRFSYYVLGYNEDVQKHIDIRYDDHAEDSGAPHAEIYARKLHDTLCRIRKSHARSYVLAPLPEMGVDVPHTLARRLMTVGSSEDITAPLTDYRARHAVVMAALQKAAETCGIQVLDPTPYLCAEGVCKGSQDGMPYYFDDDHLSETGNRRLVPMFAKLLNDRP